MASVALVTDSTAYLPPELVAQYKIAVVPLYVRFGEEVFRDGVDMTPEQFYERLSTSPIMPATSQPSPADFLKVYRQLVAEGVTEIVSVHISSKLSGTIPSAELARAELPEVTVHIFDTLSTSMGQGYMVLEAARALEGGRSVEEAVGLLERVRDEIRLLFAVDTLEFLHRGGRIGGAQAFLGSMLQLKPLLALKEGRVEAVERVRTKRRAVQRMIDLVVEEVGDQPVRAAAIHATVEDEAKRVLQRLRDRVDCREAHVTGLSPAIGTHAGPGTVGLLAYPIVEA